MDQNLFAVAQNIWGLALFSVNFFFFFDILKKMSMRFIRSFLLVNRGMVDTLRCKGLSARREWSKKELGHQINDLGLIALKFAVLKFTRKLSNITIHIQIPHSDRFCIIFFFFFCISWFLHQGCVTTCSIKKQTQTVEQRMQCSIVKTKHFHMLNPF